MLQGLCVKKLLNAIQCKGQSLVTPVRYSNTLSHVVVERHRRSKLSHHKEEKEDGPAEMAPRDYKFVHPEFLPDPIWYRRDRIREIIERKDMYRRRSVIEIPEFYVGSIMAVTASDPNAVSKSTRFVGICIDRGGVGLRAYMLLRNVLDGQGVEIMYEIYSPLLQKIEVLKLEKRLDESLIYLRDCPPEYSTVPFDMEKIAHPPGAPIPINTLKVPLNPRPHERRWERDNIKGLLPFTVSERRMRKAALPQNTKPWLKYDLMHEYRESINDDDTEQIMSEVYSKMKKLQKKDRFATKKSLKS